MFERRALIESIVLAALAREHVLVVGPAGTGRATAARRVARLLGGRYFEYLLGRSADPIELFGPVERKSGVVLSPYDDRTGMLADAEVAFLEEIFEVQTSMLNYLQWFLTDRVFRRGSAEVACALRVCVASASALDESPALRGYDERFLVRCFVAPMRDEQLESMLSEGWSRRESTERAVVGLPRFDRMVAAVDEVEWPSEVRRALVELLRRIRAEGVELADARLVRAQRLVAARAVLEGCSAVDFAHLPSVLLAIRTEADQRRAALIAARPLRTTLRPASSDSTPRVEPPASASTSDLAMVAASAPRKYAHTASYNADALRAMLDASASAASAEPAESGARDALPRHSEPRSAVRPSLPPPSRRASMAPPAPSASVPPAYKRASLPPPSRRKAIEPRSTPATEARPRARVQPTLATGSASSPARPAISASVASEPLRLSSVASRARAALHSTMPDRGAELEDWRIQIEQVLADIDKLTQQGVTSDAIRMLRGLLADALDASFARAQSSRGKSGAR